MTAYAISSPPLALKISRGLLGLMGTVVVYGSIYFSAIAPPTDVDAIGWLVGAWAFAMGVAGVVIAVRLGRGSARVRRLAVRLLGLHVLFGLVKIVGYDEPEAAVFMGVDLLLLGLLSLPAVRRWFR